MISRFKEPYDLWNGIYRYFATYTVEDVYWLPERSISAFAEACDPEVSNIYTLEFELEQLQDSDIEIAGVKVWEYGHKGYTEVKDTRLLVDAEEYLTGERMEKARRWFEANAEPEYAREVA